MTKEIVNKIVKYIKSDLITYNIGEEGIIVNTTDNSIDILMDTGIEIRVGNSDFNKHFKLNQN
jgi:small-conductance mechanosensitive channel